jgi:hypothetical protein
LIERGDIADKPEEVYVFAKETGILGFFGFQIRSKDGF